MLGACGQDSEEKERAAFIEARTAAWTDATHATDTPATASMKPTETRAVSSKGGSDLTNAQIDRMITFATMIGRGIGCGINVDAQTHNIAHWLNANVPSGETRRVYVITVEAAVQSAAIEQQSGCS